MTGRYILIECDNDTEVSLLKMHVKKSAENRIIGEFIRPDTFCSCGNWTSENGQPAVTQTRIQKLGWRICTQCMKPIPVMDFLVNQIKPQDIEKPFTEKIQLPGKAPSELGFYCVGISLPSMHASAFKKQS